MRPFPPKEQVSFLVHDELSNITLQPFTVDFRFVKGPLLVVEIAFTYLDRDGHSYDFDPQDQHRTKPILFHELIGQRVRDVDTRGHEMFITFESGRLKICSESGPFESGHIWRMEFDARGILQNKDFIVF